MMMKTLSRPLAIVFIASQLQQEKLMSSRYIMQPNFCSLIEAYIKKGKEIVISITHYSLCTRIMTVSALHGN